MDLLFVMAHWHSLAKLRMHNDLTLEVMDAVTISLGESLREFKDKTCAAFITRELEREARAHARRQSKNAAAKGKKSATKRPHRASQDVHSEFVDAGASDQPTNEPSIENAAVDDQPHIMDRTLKSFNLNTYKIHALGDYTATIRKYGTTDSYSTELVINLESKLLYDIF